MANPFFRSVHRWLPLKPFFHRRSRTHRMAGFTLTELLVSMLVAGLIIAALLYLVVEVTGANQRDAARTQVQTDMQSAMDYIAQDLREAVFVYDGQCLEGTTGGGPPPANGFSANCPGIINRIPNNLSQVGSTPILAFWRTDRLPPAVNQLCQNAAAAGVDALNTFQSTTGTPCLAGASYTLVVYVLDTDNSSNIWEGQARLRRYQLSQFNSEGNPVTGYVNPLVEPSDSFLQWPFRLDGNAVINRQTTEGRGRPTNEAPALVDFVSSRRTSDAINFTTGGGADQSPRCADFLPNPAPADPNEISPRNSSSGGNPPRGFYACVRGGGLAANSTGFNQEALVVLTGSLQGKPGFTNVKENLTPLQTRVLVRGVVNKVGS
jgi:type II secretory pathway pseudopilin PulG